MQEIKLDDNNRTNRKEMTASESESDNEDIPFECYLCAKLFFDSNKFNEHACGTRAECKHPGCKKSFATASNLRNHQVGLV